VNNVKNEDDKQKAKYELKFLNFPYMESIAVVCMFSVLIGLLLDIMIGTLPYFLLIFPLLGMVALIINVMFLTKKKMKYLSKMSHNLKNENNQY